ncbi:MAG: hexokinase [Kiritimatiellae bacterium]|nr:hexokinase [Kiritimatiellia bacterium]
MHREARDFLRAQGFDEDGGDAGLLLADFAREMDAGLAGKPSSLPMIPAFLTTGKPVPAGRPVIVLDAGGTNLRVGVVSFDAAGHPRLERFAKHKMPGTREPVGAEAFFNTLADFLMPVADASGEIGFCFSYPAEITPDCDGRLLRWSKQIMAPEVEGRMVGAELAARLAARGHRARITVLNDTVAALLAGKSAGMTRRHGSYVGYILGTGTNTAYVERNAAIAKRSDLDPDGAMIVNVESGGFSRAPRSRLDEKFDATTKDPGAYMYEKMISGAYLGGLGLTVLRAAADADMLSPATARTLRDWPGLATKDLDDFCDNPFLPTGPFAALRLSDDERRLLQALGSAVFRRAARLAAVNLAAVMIRANNGHDPLYPICANIDGSTYYRTLTAGFRSRVEGHMRALLEPRGIHYELTGIDDAPLIGAAVAGLTR